MNGLSPPDLTALRDSLLESALPSIPFDGWNLSVFRDGAERIGFSPEMVNALFPEGIQGVLFHFSDWADRKMIESLEPIALEEMRIRDRVRFCILKRLDLLAPHREAVRLSIAQWIFSPRTKALQAIWQTADKIWKRCGDTSTDYNHYTKRSLLSAVLVSTLPVWASDLSSDSERSKAFLDRRIENVMKSGKILGKFRKSKGSKQEIAA